ncbi:MAG: chromate transporter [Kiritimatiellia bacterium]|jgi:chromate transporter
MNIYLQLIWSFFKIGCLTIGGGYAMLPLIQQEIEHHGWLTTAQFMDILAIAEITPGPLSVNAATYIGYRTAGVTGSLLATTALALPSLVGMIALAASWQRYRHHPLVHAIMGALRPTVAGLIAAAAIKLGFALWENSAPGTGRATVIAIAAGAFLILRYTRVNPALIMILGGLMGALICR